MHTPIRLRLACLAAAAGMTFHAHAESFTSAASSAGSASSGSVSTSLKSSSHSSTDDEKTANGDYRIVDVAQAPDHADHLRVTMVSDESQQRIALDLPAAVFTQQGLGRGDYVHAERRVYGFEFARKDTREAFYLVLADNWHDELAPRPVVNL
ncbi:MULTISPECIES: hypothetical protein [Ralstonia solanacearum species complex]|uniref:Uncharacterized protein n=3 Tax=Ralstonia solanacearum TaxID=305 RepID=A0A7U7PR55_RALSL|nr:hypothetical protein [Ralstonia solanacearum]ALF90654.1 hypothetical protein RSUY_43500 [Ralstonia solanacearum]ATI30090.1 hypothetical protein CCY86_21840 [Ralstonia solanacearum]ATJ88827.1 hypothetical protein CDC59_21720 [Ralstonia solanacearum]EAP74847.1 Hypothetical Protein RRSL_04714 [Ralstonia solanacearum UW551]KEI31104.1 signal peptide protein [Ralstonia solanacearum]